MGERAFLLLHTPGDPPVATIYLHWGGDAMPELMRRLADAGLTHSTSYATARAIQLAGNWLDEGLVWEPMVSLGLEDAIAVADAAQLASVVDHGVWVYDWRTRQANILRYEQGRLIASRWPAEVPS